jgi:streptogramin lyase
VSRTVSSALAASLALTTSSACTALKPGDDRPAPSDAGSDAGLADAASDAAPDSHVAEYECPTVVEYPLPATSDAGAVSVAPGQIVAGPDGNLWFNLAYPVGWVPGSASPWGNGIGRMTPDGGVVEFAVTAGSGPAAIGVGPAHDVWFAEITGSVGRVTFDAGTDRPVITEYALPIDSEPNGVAAGPDGTVWFTDYANNAVVRVATDGAVLGSIPIPIENSVGTSGPNAIVAGPSPVNVMSIAEGIGALGAVRAADAGSVAEYPIPSGLPSIGALAVGPDGNIWFTDAGNNAIGRIAPTFAASSYVEYSLGASYAGLGAIAAGPDGAMWFLASQAPPFIGRISLDGGQNACPLPTASAGAWGLTLGPDGAMWFAETNANRIGRFVPR